MGRTNILVTGGTGFLGSEIVKALMEAKDFAITALDVNPPTLGTQTYSRVNYVRCDIMEPGELLAVFEEVQPTVVVHTVAVNLLGSARYSMSGKDAVFAVNVGGTRNVIEASRKCRVKALVYTSSVTVLLDELDEDFRNANETWSTGRATTIYGQSKVSRFLGARIPFEIFHGATLFHWVIITWRSEPVLGKTPRIPPGSTFYHVS